MSTHAGRYVTEQPWNERFVRLKLMVLVLNLCKFVSQLKLTYQVLQVATDLNSLATLSFHIGERQLARSQPYIRKSCFY